MSQKINSANYLREKTANYIFICIISLAIALRLLGINKGIWLDDYASIHMFSQPTLAKTLQELRTDTHPPLYFVLLHFWSKINNSEAWMRLPSIFFSVGTVYVVIQWLKKYSYLAAILGGLHFATSPILLRYAHEIRGYSLLVFAASLTFLFADRLVNKAEEKLAYLNMALSLIVAVSTHIIGVMLVIPICVFIIFSSILGDRKISWTKLAASIFIPCLLFLFFYLFYLDGDNAASRISWLPSISVELISFVTNSLFFGYTTLYYPQTFDSLVTFAIFGIVGYLIFTDRKIRELPLLSAAIIYWLQIIIYSLLLTKIYWFTSALPLLVPLVAFIVLKISYIPKKKLQKIFITGLILVCIFFTVTWTIDEAWHPLEEYEKVAQSIEKDWQQDSVAIIYPNYIKETIEYYWQDKNSKSEIAIKPGTDLKEFDTQLNRVKNYKTIFLVVRVELGIQKDLENYQNKISRIASEFTRPLTIQEFFIISNGFDKVDKDRETLHKLLAIQKDNFGQPVSYQDFNSYIFAEYKLFQKSGIQREKNRNAPSIGDGRHNRAS